jgi:hypothetical protein
MSWVAVAVGVGSAVVGGVAQNRAAKKGAQAQTDAANASNEVQLQMFNQSRQDMEPWRQAGISGLSQYMQFMGMPSNAVTSAATAGIDPGQAYLQANPDVAANPYFAQNPQEHYNRHGKGEGRRWGAAPQLPASPGAPSNGAPAKSISDMLKATPGYQFRFDEGQNAVQASAAAAGGLNSGKTLKALTQYGQNFASNEYGNHMNRLAGLANIGQTATTQIGQWGQGYAQNAGNNLMHSGAARASMYGQQGQNYAGMAGAIGGGIAQGYGYNSMMNGGGSGFYMGKRPGVG